MQTIETRRQIADIEIGDRFNHRDAQDQADSLFEITSFNGSDSAECKNLSAPNAPFRTFTRDSQLLAKVRAFALKGEAKKVSATEVPPKPAQNESQPSARRRSVTIKGVEVFLPPINQPTLAAEICRQARRGQLRVGGGPYKQRCTDVASKLSSLRTDGVCVFDDFDAALAAAYIHDVLEDTQLDSGDLIDLGIEVKVMALAEILTRREEEPYIEFIQRIADSGFKDVIHIKLADILDNISSRPTKDQIVKYTGALNVLCKTFAD